MNKMNWKSKGFLAAIAATAMLALVVPAPASAAAPDPVGPPSSSQVVTNDTAVPVELTAQDQTNFDALLAATDDTAKTFDVEAARAAGASQDAIDEAASIYSAGGGWTVTGEYNARSELRAVAANAAACTGNSAYNGYYAPWGHQVALNSCQTDQLASLVNLGVAGAAAITALLGFVGVPKQIVAGAGLVGLLIAFGAAAIQVCRSFSSNGGILINVAGTPPVSCWGQ